MKYNAFLSYSHSQDSNLAPHLETALEKFAKPLFKQRALHIFRDANDLSASPNLWGKIEEGLKESEYFIFLASPKAAQSRWCKKEVDCWKANHDMSNFLVVLTDGEIAWDESKSDFDWSKTTAIPDNLSGAFINEPLYVDFRNHNNEELGLEYPDFKTKTVLLAATIHGKSVGDMIGENVKQHKKTIRIRNSAITILSLLVIAAGLLTYVAITEKNRAEDQTKIATEKTEEAKKQTTIAEAQTIEAEVQKENAFTNQRKAELKSLINASQGNLSNNANLAFRLAEYAYHFADSLSLSKNEVNDALITAFYNTSHFYLEHQGFDISDQSSEIEFPFPKLLEYNGAKLIEPVNTNDPDFEYKYPIQYSKGKIKKEFQYPGHVKYSLGPEGKFFSSVWEFQMDGSEFTTIIVDTLGKVLWEGKSYFPLYAPSMKMNTKGNRFLVYDDTGAALIEFGIRGSFDNPNDYYQIRSMKFNSKPISTDLNRNGNICIFGLENGEIHIVEFNESNNRLFDTKRWEIKTINSEKNIKVRLSKDEIYILTGTGTIVDHRRDDLPIKRKFLLKPSPSFIKMPNIYDESKVSQWEEKNGYLNNSDGTKFLNKKSSCELVDKTNKTIAVFSDFNKFEGVTITSKNKLFYANDNALFNLKGDLLVSFVPMIFQPMESWFPLFCGFSDDDQYYKKINRIYYLNPDTIISRFNNEAIFGNIPKLTREEKAKYHIEDLN